MIYTSSSHETFGIVLKFLYLSMKVVNVFLWCLSLFLFSCGVQFEPVGNYTDYDIDQKNRNRSIDLHPYRGAPLNAEEGKCYAKCLIEDQYGQEIISLIEYTGDDYESEYIELQTVELSPATEKWVRKIADPSCLSDNPDDCLVWCLVEVPSEEIERYVVLDTTIIQDYVIEEYDQKYLIKAGGFNEWKEVVCAKDITTSFIQTIEQRLFEEGYIMELIGDGVNSAFIKSALAKYQKENGLPLGNFNLETIKALNVKY